MKNLTILGEEYYSSQDTQHLARSILGKYIVRELGDMVLIGRINEVEAYLKNDPAAHSYKGRTERTRAMFEEAGTVYIYFSYGVHWCMNIAGGPTGVGEGILIRGFEPIVGIDIMKRNREISELKNLSNGPGKVTQALGITKEFYGHKIWEPPLYIAEDKEEITLPELIKTSPRIGISKNKESMLRFYL